MSEIISDGSATWIGGMDASRSPIDISEGQYSRGCNVIIPRSLGGIKVRPGIHFQYLDFDSADTEELYKHGHVQAEGWFNSGDKFYLIAVVNNIILRFTQNTGSSFYVEALNCNDPNSDSDKHWVIQIPNGCIVNNGIDLPLYVNEVECRRTNPDNDEIGIGRMGVYVQNRLFYSNSAGNLIIASDFNNPLRNTEAALTGIIGFQPPENTDKITAISRQKVMLEYAEGGALIFSTRNSIYSVDVRSDRNTWGDQSTRLGKVTQTVEGLSAASSYSFESFGTNIFYRSYEHGIADLRQSQYQFNQLDASVGMSIEVDNWLENDTPWMLDGCYSRAWNSRLFTTVAPEQDDEQRVFWNGMVSYHPASIYSSSTSGPRRYESLITGVRPWCLTVAKPRNDTDQLFIHSYDEDGINRLYRMVQDSDYDINEDGKRVNIRGWIETKGYDFKARFTPKEFHKAFYSLREFSRDLHIEVLGRTEASGKWTTYHDVTHKIGEPYIYNEGSAEPVTSMPQTRYQVNMSEPNFSDCNSTSNKFIWIQDRIEFSGPLYLDSLIHTARPKSFEGTSYKEGKVVRHNYEPIPDFSYSIVNAIPIT